MKKQMILVGVAVASLAAGAYSPKPVTPFYRQDVRSHTGISSIAVSPRRRRR